MLAPQKINFKIYQGSTFREVIRWESSQIAYAPITQITKAAPMVVTSTAHGIPLGWRTKITNVAGMKEVNSSDYKVNSSVTSNTLVFDSINSLAFSDYVSGGVLEYNTPIDLTGYTARMQIREKITDVDILEELTTSNGKIIIDVSGKSIILNIDATTTSSYGFTSGVYSLELISTDNVVTTLCTGGVSLVKEITRV